MMCYMKKSHMRTEQIRTELSTELCNKFFLVCVCALLNIAYCFCATSATTGIAVCLVPAQTRLLTLCVAPMAWSSSLLATPAAKQETRNRW